MIIKANTKLFLKALQQLKIITNRKYNLDVLTAIKINTDEDGAMLTANNCSFEIKQELPCEVIEHGKAVIELKSLEKALKASGAFATLQCDVNNLIDVDGIKMQGWTEVDFPNDFELHNRTSFNVDMGEFRGALSKVINCVSDTRTGAVNNLLIENNGFDLVLVGCDGYMLAKTMIKGNYGKGGKYIVPRDAAKAIYKLPKTYDKQDVKITVGETDDKHEVMCFELNDVKIYTFLYELEYLNWEKIIDGRKEPEVTISISRSDLRNVVSCAKDIYSQEKATNKILVMECAGDEAKFTCRSYSAAMEKTIPAKVSGAFKIGFDPILMDKLLSGITYDKLTLCCTNAVNAIFIRNAEDMYNDDECFLILPIRMKN